MHRLPRGVSLTPAGEIVRIHIDRMFEVMEGLSNALTPVGELRGQVSIGASTLLEPRLASIIRDCTYRYPGVTVSPQRVALRTAKDGVASVQVDIALVHGDAPTSSGTAVAEQMPPLEVVPVGSAELVGIIVESRLTEVRVLVVDPDCSSHNRLVDGLRAQYGIRASPVAAGSLWGAREMVRSGYGVAMLPSSSVELSERGFDDGLTVDTRLWRARLGVWALWLGPGLALQRVAKVYDLARRAE